MARLLVVFAKEPVAARVKTRLLPRLDAGQAARLYRAFVQDITRRWAGWPGVRLILAHWPPSSRELFERLAAPGWEFAAQQGDGLADRMAAAFTTLASRSDDTMVLTNSDSPDLPRDRIDQAFDWLEEGRCDVVLGPDDGGGYYLVGQSGRPEIRIFQGVSMGGEGVFEATLRRCEALGLGVGLLEEFADVDTPADLERLALRLAEDPRQRGILAETTIVLRDLGLLPGEATS